MKLTLTRPIVNIDLETTSKVVTEARILQIAFDKYAVDGSIKSWSHLFNPGCPIPPESTEKHHITDADVIGKPPFNKEFAENLVKGFAECDFLGYNVLFDLDVLALRCQEFGVVFSYDGAAIVDALALWRNLDKRTLSDAVKYWLGRSHDDAHDARADTQAAMDVLDAQIEQRKLPTTPEALNDLGFPKVEGAIDRKGKLVKNAAGEIEMKFGKHAGRTLAEVARRDRRYLIWLINDSNMALDFKNAVKEFLNAPKAV